MPTRCEDCKKFVSLDSDIEPEETSTDLTFSGDEATGMTADYSADVRIVNQCAECSTEMREANFEVSGSFDIDCSEYTEEQREGWGVSLDELSRIEEGGGRFSKKFYGFEGKVVLKDADGEVLESVEVSDQIQASHMDEL